MKSINTAPGVYTIKYYRFVRKWTEYIVSLCICPSATLSITTISIRTLSVMLLSIIVPDVELFYAERHVLLLL